MPPTLVSGGAEKERIGQGSISKLCCPDWNSTIHAFDECTFMPTRIFPQPARNRSKESIRRGILRSRAIPRSEWAGGRAAKEHRDSMRALQGDIRYAFSEYPREWHAPLAAQRVADSIAKRAPFGAGPAATRLCGRRDAPRGKPFSCLSGKHHPPKTRGRSDESIYSTSRRSSGTDATPTLSRARTLRTKRNNV
ncbi:hypothetical protein KM043_003324 [Ampulex compressa]|nr:hypothetical protein KM043_003324 [Ampulex compressa]